MNKLLTKKNIHISFHIGLVLKGLNDVGEILLGTLLLFVTPDKLSKFITLISANELSEDPNDFIMRHLISFSQTFSVDMQFTASLYLLSHGIAKLLIIYFLWKQKLWAYPLSCVLFTFFVIVQSVRFSQTHSIGLLFLTVIDLLMIFLTVLEYRNIKVMHR